MRRQGYIDGDCRIVRRFPVLFPLQIGRDVRWFEVCYVKQLCNERMVPCWRNQQFVTRDEYIKNKGKVLPFVMPPKPDPPPPPPPGILGDKREKDS